MQQPGHGGKEKGGGMEGRENKKEIIKVTNFRSIDLLGCPPSRCGVPRERRYFISEVNESWSSSALTNLDLFLPYSWKLGCSSARLMNKILFQNGNTIHNLGNFIKFIK